MQSIGDQLVPLLPAEQREEYVRQVSTLEGFVSLAASISRTSQDLLAEVSRGEEPIIVRLGRLERTVVWHLALADNWKFQHDEAKEASSARGASWPPIPTGCSGTHHRGITGGLYMA